MFKKCPNCKKNYKVGTVHKCELAPVKKSSNGDGAIHSKKWRDFRKTIILRDLGYCQRCKALFNKYEFENLEVHHIKPREHYPELTFEEDNCVTLCRTCNRVLGMNGIDFKWEVGGDSNGETS